jgi:hypothetical protein
LTKIIIWAIAVFICSVSVSEATFLMVLCNVRSRSGSDPGSASVSLVFSSPVLSSTTRRQTRCRNRATPSTPFVCHGFWASRGPMNSSYMRIASAP